MQVTVDVNQLDKQISAYVEKVGLDIDEGLFELLCSIHEEVELNGSVLIEKSKE